jgi:hypothetical protein
MAFQSILPHLVPFFNNDVAHGACAGVWLPAANVLPTFGVNKQVPIFRRRVHKKVR